ncbi:unnamed protein product [Protopolystoma xenopodis]|uniref:Uncharacterized protein n=1 Tax=Protopolystoma xenopodis TaxID=117903 RepID=A0A448X5M7_9PLAT|nr:unnamed protein product [Protopolystoma xenopodis]
MAMASETTSTSQGSRDTPSTPSTGASEPEGSAANRSAGSQVRPSLSDFPLASSCRGVESGGKKSRTPLACLTPELAELSLFYQSSTERSPFKQLRTNGYDNSNSALATKSESVKRGGCKSGGKFENRGPTSVGKSPSAPPSAALKVLSGSRVRHRGVRCTWA